MSGAGILDHLTTETIFESHIVHITCSLESWQQDVPGLRTISIERCLPTL